MLSRASLSGRFITISIVANMGGGGYNAIGLWFHGILPIFDCLFTYKIKLMVVFETHLIMYKIKYYYYSWIKVHSIWNKVHSLWNKVHSLWNKVYSLWNKVHSLWNIVYSLWNKVHSLWNKVHSLWNKVHSLWSISLINDFNC